MATLRSSIVETQRCPARRLEVGRALIEAELPLPVKRRRREVWETLIEAQRGRSGEVLESQRADERRSRLQSAILKLDRRRRAGEDAMASAREGGSGDLCLWEEKSTRFVDVDELQRRGW